MSLVRNASFLIVKHSGVREKVSDVNKSLCKSIFLVSSRLCNSPLVRAPPQLTLFTSPTTPSMSRHMRGIQFTTLEISESPDKFTGKRKTQINIYVLKDEVWVHFAHRRAHPKSPPPKNNRKHARTHTEHQHLFANFLAQKNTVFSSLSGHKQQRLLCRVFGFGGIGCVGGDTATALRC